MTRYFDLNVNLVLMSYSCRQLVSCCVRGFSTVTEIISWWHSDYLKIIKAIQNNLFQFQHWSDWMQKSHTLIDVTRGKQAKESKVIFLSNCKHFTQTVTERLAEVNTSLTLLLCVCLYLSNSAVKFSSSLELNKTPEAFTAELQTLNQKLNPSDWLVFFFTFFLLLSLLHSLLFVFLHIKLLSSFSVAERFSRPSEPSFWFILRLESCVLFIKQENQPSSAVDLSVQVSGVRCASSRPYFFPLSCAS